MRRLAALMVTAAAFGGLSSLAEAGPPATDPNGNFMVVDIDVFPPRAGQGVTIGYHFFGGNRLTGQRPPGVRDETIRFPGFRSNGRLFPKCPLPRTAQELGRNRCSNAARVGGGTGEADARPLVGGFIPIRVSAFNGSLRNGNPTLIFLATATVGSQAVNAEIDFEVRRAGGGFNLVLLPAPPGAPTGLFSLTRADLTFGKTIRRRRGRRTILTSFIEAPLTCRPQGWLLSQTTAFTDGSPTLTARDVHPCVRG
jgi:hypothetical protein